MSEAIMDLGYKIQCGEATPQDAIEWMKLTSNGHEIEDYEISEENWAKMNALKSRLLVALSNTTPYLSQDVNVGGCSGIILKQK